MCVILQILAKADMRIAALYDQQLVSGEAELQLGRMLRQKFAQTQEAVLEVCARLRAAWEALTPAHGFAFCAACSPALADTWGR